MNTNTKQCIEPWLVQQHLASIANPIIFDVGAHTGEFSSYLRDHTTKPQIFAFEPHPKAFQKLNSLEGITAVNAEVSNDNQIKRENIES